MASETRLQWANDEWLSLIGGTLPLIASGMHKVDALLHAQRKAIHKTRHRDRQGMGKLCTPSNGGFDRALAAFLALPAAERARLSPALPEPAPVRPKKAATKAVASPIDADAGGLVRWTSRERAIMAAGVELLRQEDGHGTLPLTDLYIKAQRMILPADRWRSEDGIKQAGRSKGLLQRQHDEGIANGWQYPETQNPFRRPPGDVTTALAPASALALAATVPEAQAAVEPQPVDARPMQEAVFLFGSTMTSALESLLKTRDEQMTQQLTQDIAEQAARRSAEQTAALSERIGQLVQELLQVQIGHIAVEVSKGLRAVLHEELGGPSPTPGAPATPAAPPAAPTTPPPAATSAAPGRAGLRVDVIGTIPVEWMQRIRDATGAGDEVRFVDFASARDFAPHRGRHLIVMAQGKMPRVLQKKCEAAGVQPISVRDAAGHVLRAVQDLKGGATSVTLQ